MSAFRRQATVPAFIGPDEDRLELAELTERLASRLERLRHVVARRLADEGRGLADSLRGFDSGLDQDAIVDRVLSFQSRARDLLSGSR